MRFSGRNVRHANAGINIKYVLFVEIEHVSKSADSFGTRHSGRTRARTCAPYRGFGAVSMSWQSS